MSKITIDRAVVEEALDFLETNYITQRNADEVVAAIHAALEQPEQEPVAWMCTETGVLYDHDTSEVDKHHGFKPTVPLYAHPPTPRKPEQQPVATIHVDGSFVHVRWTGTAPDQIDLPVYTAPTPRKWWELTEEEIYKAIKGVDSLKAVEVARAVIAAYERKNGITGEGAA